MKLFGIVSTIIICSIFIIFVIFDSFIKKIIDRKRLKRYIKIIK